MKKTIVTLIILAGLGFLGWRVYVKLQAEAAKPGGPGGPGGKRGPMAVAVEVAPISKAAMRDVSQFSGTLIPRSRFIVAPKISGRLEKLTVNVGDMVKPDQKIAELEALEYVQDVAQAKAELAVAEASVAELKSNLEVAKRELDRVKTLREKQVASESELDEANARHNAAVAKIEVAAAEIARREAALKAAQIRLSYTTITASWGDDREPRVVGERFVDQGAMLRANDPIVSILDNRVLTAQIDVIERDYPKVKVGQRAQVTTDAFPDRQFDGTIIRIAPLLKETSRQARVEIEIPNPELLLKPGMFVRVEIEFTRRENAIVVPVSALSRRDGKPGVFLVDTETLTAKFVTVKQGIMEGKLVEILEPPLSGQVITLGQHLLEDGGAIRLPGAAPGGKDSKGKGDKGKGDAAGKPAGKPASGERQ